MPVNVAITGLTAAGKSTIANLLVSKLGGHSLPSAIYGSSLVKAEVLAQGDPLTARTVRDHAYMRNRAEPTYWVSQAIKSGRAAKVELIIVDGVRNLAGLRYLEQLADPYVTIGVTAGYRTRLRRKIEKPSELERDLTSSEIGALLREEMIENPEPWGFQISQCLSLAHFTIQTERGDLSCLLHQLEPAVERLSSLLMRVGELE